MTQMTVLAVGGTGESYPGDDRTDVSGLLRAVTDELDDRFTGRWVGYPASYGPVAVGGLSYRDSAVVGVSALAAEIENVRGPIALIGYSQGCTVVRELLGAIANGTIRANSVVAAGFVSDPEQPVGAVAGLTGHGVAGTGPAIPTSIQTLWIGDRFDMICNASDDSLMRDVADITSSMTLRAIALWMRGLWTLLRTNDFQNARKTVFGPRQWTTDIRRLRTAIVEILGYLPATLMWHFVKIRNPGGGRHTAYASEPYGDGPETGCQVLARWLELQIPTPTDNFAAA